MYEETHGSGQPQGDCGAAISKPPVRSEVVEGSPS